MMDILDCKGDPMVKYKKKVALVGASPIFLFPLFFSEGQK